MIDSKRKLRGMNMKMFKLLILTFSTLALANCSSLQEDSSRQIATDGSSKICNSKSEIKDCMWNSCYNQDENRVYFIPLDTITKCKSKTFFTGPKDPEGGEAYIMTDSGVTDDGFTTGRAGVPVQQKRRDGSRVFVSSWNNMEKYNHIIVIEPNFSTNTSKKLCHFRNYSETFSSRENDKTGEIEILIREPKSKKASDDDNYHYVWKTCG